MKTFESYLPKGHPNRPGTPLEALKAVVIHYTGNENLGATDTMNAGYIARQYAKGPDGKIYERDEAGTPFHYGSAHVFVDRDSATLTIPTNEVAWGCGDRNMLWDEKYRGMKPIATKAFGRRQNFQTVSVEICNNADWDAAVHNAAGWVASFLLEKELGVDVELSLHPESFSGFKAGLVPLFRHHDLTGKACPKPFVDKPVDWEAFVRLVDKIVRGSGCVTE